jgi:hypothetical protein
MHKLLFKNQFDSDVQANYSAKMNEHLIRDLKPTQSLKTEESATGCLFCLGMSF